MSDPKYNQVLDSGGTLKLPGEQDPDFGRFVSDYLKPFKKYHVTRTHKAELYKWCSTYIGQKYRDWFIYEGGSHDRVWVVNILKPKHSTLFELRWSDIIVKTIDRQ